MKKKSTLAILIALVPILLALVFFVIFWFSDGSWTWLMLLLFVAPITALVCNAVSIILSVLALKKHEPAGRALTALCICAVNFILAVGYALRFLI